MRQSLFSKLFLLAAFSFFSCSRGEKKNEIIHEKIVYKNDVATFNQPPLTPELIDKAVAAFERGFVHESNAWDRWWGKYTENTAIANQGNSRLCLAFAFRDLLVNNLQLDLENTPSIFSLLELNYHAPGSVLLGKELAYNNDDFNILGLGGSRSKLRKESDFPFDTKIFARYDEIKAGKGFDNGKVFISSSELPKRLTLIEKQENGDVLVEALAVKLLTTQKVTDDSFVKLPKFKFSRTLINTLTLVDEMKALGQRLGRGKAQVISVCGSSIRGFSKKLLPFDSNDLDWVTYLNTGSRPAKCVPHAVLVTAAKREVDSGEIVLRFKNSWGPDYTDSGYHEISLNRFILMLRNWSDDPDDTRIFSSRTELDLVDNNVEPIHLYETAYGWRITAPTKDGLTPVDNVSISNRFDSSSFKCEIENKQPLRCHGTLRWAGPVNLRNQYVYNGDVKVTGLSMTGFDDFWAHGNGRLSLWGNLVKEGDFELGTLRRGVYREFYSNGKSPLVSLVEEGDFDSDEFLIKGTRNYYDRSGTVYKTEKIGIEI